jgi:hypothetical protein
MAILQALVAEEEVEMNYKMPIIDLRVKLAAEDIVTAIVLHEHEISEQVQAGVDKAVKDIGYLIKEKAESCAKEAINEAVSNYFRYGEGYQAVNLAVKKALNDIIKKDFNKELD